MTPLRDRIAEAKRLHEELGYEKWTVEKDGFTADNGAGYGMHRPRAAAIVALHNIFPELVAYVEALEAVADLAELQRSWIPMGRAMARLDALRNGGK